MKNLGFSALLSEECVFVRRKVWIYVDDIIVMGPERFAIDHVKNELMNHLEVKDLGRLHHFLGVTFIPDSRGA